MITVTEAAQARLREIIAEEANPALRLRISVAGGGCSGFQYGFSLEETQEPDDIEIDLGSARVLIDPMSGVYLSGAQVDFRSDVSGETFTITNPNASHSCGCGSSFSV